MPYWFFEENDFQACYGLVISQATYRPGMLEGLTAFGIISVAVTPVISWKWINFQEAIASGQ